MIDPVNLPVGFTQSDLDGLLKRCVEAGASDVTIQSGDFAWAEIHGRLVRATTRPIYDNEAKMAITFIYGPNATGVLAGGGDLDPRYEIKVDRYTTYSFRVNATSGIIGDVNGGVSITLRTIPGLPPTLDTLELPQSLETALFPQNGMVLVVGVTGSGKSTLLASGVRWMLEHGEDRKILEYAMPIEFTFVGVDSKCPLPCQSEIGRHLPSYEYGIRNAMRRKPSVILIGEARDSSTMDALVEAALTGHATYSTVHAKTVGETVERIVHLFPYEAQSAAASRIMGCLHLIVAQKLVKSLDGKRVALREWLHFDQSVKRELVGIPAHQWPTIVSRIIDERGQSMRHSAQIALDRGLIDEKTFREALSEVGVE